MWDKRMVMYQVCRTYLGAITATAAPSTDELRTFPFGTADARWLFDPEIADYFYKELYQQGENLKMYYEDMQSESPGQRKSELGAKVQNLREWFRAQVDEIDKRLDRFMMLKH